MSYANTVEPQPALGLMYCGTPLVFFRRMADFADVAAQLTRAIEQENVRD